MSSMQDTKKVIERCFIYQTQRNDGKTSRSLFANQLGSDPTMLLWEFMKRVLEVNAEVGKLPDILTYYPPAPPGKTDCLSYSWNFTAVWQNIKV